MILNWFLAHLMSSVMGQDGVSQLELPLEHRSITCDCMEYWECINRGGEPYSYCGLSESSVCCSLPPLEDDGAKPKCGIKGFDSGVVGISEPSEWPWHVAIVEDPGFYYVCGGSLIDESWVLTAAHCVEQYITRTDMKLKVRLGEHDITRSTESLPHEDRAVLTIITHPRFNATTLESDIALLRLNLPAKQRHHIDVVCLPEMESNRVDRVQDSTCFLTGWGKTTQNGNYSSVLKEVPIPLWENKDCETTLKREFGELFTLQNNTFCAGATGRDACDGDGGGPLVCQEDGQWTQYGIVSYGFGCGQRGFPGVYTRVSFFQQWITLTVLNNK